MQRLKKALFLKSNFYHMDDNQVDIKSLNEKIEKESGFVDLLQIELGKVIVGQQQMIERLLIGLLGQGHILLEGVPGLAKTLAINSLSKAIKASFSRVQFTPDLLPADVIGTMIYNIKENDFSIKKGPVFANFVLADEINRAPAKVQSALLEAMQERQVTIGDESFTLKPPFLVMATQNPVEQEGTYPLPEAQVDRFMLKVIIDYPNKTDEQQIVRSQVSGATNAIKPVVTTSQVIKAQKDWAKKTTLQKMEEVFNNWGVITEFADVLYDLGLVNTPSEVIDYYKNPTIYDKEFVLWEEYEYPFPDDEAWQEFVLRLDLPNNGETRI